MAGIRTPQDLTLKAKKSHGGDLPSLEEVMPKIFEELEVGGVRKSTPSSLFRTVLTVLTV